MAKVAEGEWDPDGFFSEVLHPDWHHRAECRGMDPAIFYPERGALNNQAKVICALCEVRDLCRAAGEGERLGIWGGMTPPERRLAQRRQRVEA